MKEVQAYRSMSGQLYQTMEQAEYADLQYMKYQIRGELVNRLPDDVVPTIYQFLVTIKSK